MANYGFIIDNRRCIGCHACTVACKSEHQVPIGVNRTWVKYVEKGTFPTSRRLFSVLRCNHCNDAPCVEICPVTALYRRADGIVDFDNRRCIGCKACMQACPYDALYIDPETQTAAKCNYCAHRVDVGLEPACVVVCPTQAIVSGDLDDPQSRIAQIKNRHQVTARKVEKGTLPQLFYIDGDVDSLDPMATSATTSTLWGQQARGVGQHAPDGSNQLAHPLDLLGEWLAVKDSDPRRQSDKEQLVRHVMSDQSPRRAYDAPNKGITWGWQVPSYLFTKGIAAGAILVPLAAVSLGVTLAPGLLAWSVVWSLVFLVATGLLLIADLKQPRRFLYVLLRPQWRSWLVKGAYLITAFGAAVPAYWLVASLGALTAIEPVMRWIAMLLAVGAAVYTAFLLAQAKGRDYWQSSVLPWQMLAHSAMLGAAWLGLLAPWLDAAWVVALSAAMALAAAVHLAGEAIEIHSTHATRAAKRVVKLLTRGRFRRAYWAGSILAGGALPLVLCLTGTSWGLFLASALVLPGVFVSQYLLVYVPQQVPLS